MEQQPYFERVPPKSTDGPEMIQAFRALFDAAGVSLEKMPLADALATACQFTAQTIARAIDYLVVGRVDELIVSGGGVENECLMQELGKAMNNIPIERSEVLGVGADAKEAVAFAILGAATLDGVPSNVPSVTGASRGVVLGSITPRPA
jgi:anhydro-N-acetylmuramic acid kinase